MLYEVITVFKIPVNKWTVPTAVLGGVFVVAGLVLTMNYNHPYTYVAQKAVVAVPIISQVVGVVDEVPVRRNEHLKAGDELFRIDPTVYQARVDRLQADLVTAEQSVAAQRSQLSVTEAHRITSYNVCYTKLLRSAMNITEQRQQSIDFTVPIYRIPTQLVAREDTDMRNNFV